MAEASRPADIPWAPRSDPEHFATTGGVHLDDRSQRLFAERLDAWAETLPGWRMKRGRAEAVASYEAR